MSRQKALELSAAGLGYKRIARELGVSWTTAWRWTHPEYEQRQLAVSRQAKQRRGGTCERCGDPTRYGGKTGKPAISRFCRDCGSAESARLAKEKIGTGPAQARLREFLESRGIATFTEIVQSRVIGDKSPASGRLHRMLRQGLIERVDRGKYRWAAE